ncbi:general stress protein 26 [Haloactinomyces albus]|uniref:General stress protein 26 n=2 Tax=Haloactinomyces albus TaxID=1352928 RepID=A0AAE4CRR0_9ACTN|nr:general stress protein 26 [Haloactinomyces albus]
MSFLHHEGTFWLTAVEDRAHARAVLDDPRVTLVISNAGTGLPGRRMLAVRGVATVHRDEAVKQWFFERFCPRFAPADSTAFKRLLDSPKRVVFQVRPVAIPASHDSRKIGGDGRGGGQTVRTDR